MLSMRQSYRMIPVYTADVSGVCSALYELGGMTVMHDPSGCNSTYNTHDEIRWYDQDSLIFISGLTEIDAIMGNDRKFIDDIEYAARELHPKFIALAGSPIPFMNGTDFPAIARVIETETGIPAFSVPTNGMNDYVYGAGIALEEIAKRFVREPDRQENRDPSSRTVNLLGVTPLDFGPQKNAETLKENLQKYGWQAMSVWAMGDDLKTLQRSAEADVNLVVSAVGLRVAKILWEKYKIPYVIGTPNEWLAEDISNALERAATRQAEPAVVYLQNRMQQEADITLVGEPVTMGSLAAGIEKRYGRAARVLCPLKECADLLGEKDKMVLGEEAMEEALKSAGIIVADPLYRPICPGDSIFYELPHVAFSGRIGQTYVIFDEIEENPSVETVAVAAGIAVKEQVDFFVAVGGGSPMDASKAISLLAANPSAIDHAEERLYHPELMQGYPVAAVPTTSGTGSEVTPYAILTRHDLHTKQSIAHKWFADLAFVDAGYLKTSSYENMVSTCVDALAHLIESYLNTNANAYNRIYSAEGLRIWGSAKEYLLSSGIKIPDEGYETFMHASVVAGMAIAHTGTSIPHGLSYPVTYELGIPHGKAVGFFLPGFLRFYNNQKRVAEVLELLGFENRAEFIAYLDKLLGKPQIPEKLWEEDVQKLLQNPAKLKNYPFEMTEEILKKYLNK